MHFTGISEKIAWRSVYITLQIDLGSFISQVERICTLLASLTRIRSLSDIVPGSWFVANDSQLWIRFSSSEFSMGMSSFRLFFTETIQCSSSNNSSSVCSDIGLSLSLGSTQSPKADVQVVQHLRSFPFQIISSATHGVYHNLTKVLDRSMRETERSISSIGFRLVFGISKGLTMNVWLFYFDPLPP